MAGPSRPVGLETSSYPAHLQDFKSSFKMGLEQLQKKAASKMGEGASASNSDATISVRVSRQDEFEGGGCPAGRQT